MKLDFLILEKGISNFLQLNPTIKTLVHCDLFSEISTYFEQSKALKKLNIFQLAFGTYMIRATPEFVRGEEFLCFSKVQANNLKAMASNPDSVNYRGNMYQHLNAFTLQDIKSLFSRKHYNIAYFTQPYDKEGEQRLIQELKILCANLGYSLSIIFHPRDSITQYSGTPAENVRTISNLEYLKHREELESSFCFALMRNSNIGLRLIFQGIPIINLSLSSIDKLVQQEYFTDIH